MKNMMLWLITFVASTQAQAVNDLERHELTRLVKELEYVNSIIVVAKNSSDENARVKFDYEVLEKDVGEIKKGIVEHLKSERRDPRVLPEIKKEYFDSGR